MTYLLPGKTARESLDWQFDGRIPPALKAWAEAYDRQNPLPAPRLAVRVGRVTLSRRVLVDLMARIIVEAVTARGHVAEADFERAAIPADVARAHLAEAHARALALEARLPAMLEDAA